MTILSVQKWHRSLMMILLTSSLFFVLVLGLPNLGFSDIMICRNLFNSKVTAEEKAMAKAGQHADAAITVAKTKTSQAPEVIADNLLRKLGVNKTPSELRSKTQLVRPPLPQIKDIHVGKIQSLFFDVAPNIFGKKFEFYSEDKVSGLFTNDHVLTNPAEVLNFLALNETYLRQEYTIEEYDTILGYKDTLARAFNRLYFLAESETREEAAGKIHAHLQRVKNRDKYIFWLALRIDRIDIRTTDLFFEWLQFRENLIGKQIKNPSDERAQIITAVETLISKYLFEIDEMFESTQKMLLKKIGTDKNLLMLLVSAGFVLIPEIIEIYKTQLTYLRRDNLQDMQIADSIFSYLMQFDDFESVAKNYLRQMLDDPDLHPEFRRRFKFHLQYLGDEGF